MKNIFRISGTIFLFLVVYLAHSCTKDKPVPPTLSTTLITNISYTTASSGGIVTNEGGANVALRGVCWNTSTNPTINNNISVDGSGLGTFTSNINNLSPNTLYYIRAYALNSSGEGYGNEISFTTSQISVPALTTSAITSITQTTAVSGGNITDENGGSVTQRGVCWSTTSNPTVDNSKTSDGTGTGTFVSNLTGLIGNTIYYVRAYAANSAGTAYGNEVSFTSNQIVVPTLTSVAITSITTSTATSGGNVLNDGGGTITGKGVCWATTANPTISNSITSVGTGTGSYVSNITGLLPGTTYHVRAYAVNSAGTAYGNDISFTSVVAIPTLTTTAATSITQTNAVSGGNITADGGGTVMTRGTCWATTTNPTTSNSLTSDGTGTGTFVSNLIGLAPGTTYHIRAYAINSAGTAYGNDLTFTAAVSVPTLTTTAITSIAGTTALSGGNITSDGDESVTARGVCWSTSSGPDITGSKTTDGTGTGIFTSNITGLSAGVKYYVRAYATNSAGTGYGNQISFNTLIADIDGNIYDTVRIGTQTWMKENLRVTKFNDGTDILLPTDDYKWMELIIPAYCWYNNDISNKETYGALYNWWAANSGKLCPVGWHVPTVDEFVIIAPPYGRAGYDLMESGTSHWISGLGTNMTGFTALPGGARGSDFEGMGESGSYWTFNVPDYMYSGWVWWYPIPWQEAWGSTPTSTLTDPHGGFSVRCLKDN